jgi:hypothetical protein
LSREFCSSDQAIHCSYLAKMSSQLSQKTCGYFLFISLSILIPFILILYFYPLTVQPLEKARNFVSGSYSVTTTTFAENSMTIYSPLLCSNNFFVAYLSLLVYISTWKTQFFQVKYILLIFFNTEDQVVYRNCPVVASPLVQRTWPVQYSVTEKVRHSD